jgi:hypothetical protein
MLVADMRRGVGIYWTARLPAGEFGARNDRSKSLLSRLGFLEVGATAVEVRPGVTRSCLSSSCSGLWLERRPSLNGH